MAVSPVDLRRTERDGMNDLATVPASQILIPSDGPRNARTALGLWLTSFRGENTRRAYSRGMRPLRRSPGVMTPRQPS